MAYRFYPPISRPGLRALVHLVAPLILRLRNQVVHVELQGIEYLPKNRAILLPNHPSETEPSVMALLARAQRQPYYFLATHELFTGLDGWIAQRMGAFSVRRGWPDRASLTFAATLLAEQNTLVVFPEGETHQRGNEILPLKLGAAQLGFWALQRSPGPLPLVPIHIAYRYLQPERLWAGLEPLERALGIEAQGTASQRLRTCGLAVLTRIEREHGIFEAPPQVEARIAQLYARIETNVCLRLGIPPPHQATVPVRLRALFNAAFDSPHSEVLPELWRVQNFMAVRDELPETEERFAELLFRLEKDVFGKPRTLPLRTAHLRIGPPLELEDWLPSYRQSRKKALLEVTRELERRLHALLADALAAEVPLIK